MAKSKKKRKRYKRTAIPKLPAHNRSKRWQLWRVVDGAVADAFAMHPDYLTPKGARGNTARLSIVKRVVGEMTGFVAKAAQGRPVR